MQLWASGVAGRADDRRRSYANQVKCRKCGDLSRLHLPLGVNVVFADKCEALAPLPFSKRLCNEEGVCPLSHCI